MNHKLVTCPDSAHLEEIGFEDDPLGVLIVECSRFSPACAVRCPRTCAARLDKREHSGRIERLEPEPVPLRDTQVSVSRTPTR